MLVLHASAGRLKHPTHLLTPSALLHAVVSFADRLVCGLHGHEMVRRFEPRRLSLRCLLCGAETAGWSLDAPAVRYLPRTTVRHVPVRVVHAARNGHGAAAARPALRHVA
jgi:hypothetical protein